MNSRLSNDPTTFCMLYSLPLAMIQFSVKKSPMKPEIQDLPQKQFPRDKYHRSFQTAWL